MTTFLVVLGVLVLLATAADIVVTTASVSSGRGPLSSQVAARVWSVVLAVHTRLPGHRLIQAAGPVILFGIIVTWLLLLSIGWALVLSPADALEADDPSFLRRMHFAATVVVGRGATPLEVSEGGWWIAEQLAGLSGVALISLSIAYVLPVVSAVVNKRQVAASVTMLGGSPQEVLANAWSGKDLGDLDLHLIDLAGMVQQATQQHLAYPVLYYFHSPYRDFALAPSIVVLDETLTLVEHALAERPGLSGTAWRPVRQAVDQLLLVIGDSSVRPHDETPPPPSLDGLRDRGLPVVDDERWEAAVSDLGERRRLLRGFLAFEGRGWPPERELHADEPAEDSAEPGSG